MFAALTTGALSRRILIGAGCTSVGFISARLSDNIRIKTLQDQNKELHELLEKNAQIHYVILKDHEKHFKHNK